MKLKRSIKNDKLYQKNVEGGVLLSQTIKLLTLTTLLIFTGCGGGGGSSTSTTQTLQAQLIDSPIQGVRYTTDSQRGVTTSEGNFTYQSNDTFITFKIGEMLLADFNLSALHVDKRLTPPELVGEPRENTRDEKVLKLLRVLQSLDEDGNPANGIVIHEDTISLFTTPTNILAEDIENLIEMSGKELISPRVALIHFEEVLRDTFGLDVDTVEPQAPTTQTLTEMTQEDSISIDMSGEVGTSVFIDGIDTSKTIGVDGTATISVDLQEGTNSFSITLKDAKDNESEALIFTIEKETPASPPVFTSSNTASVAENQTSAITLTASNTTSYAISGTDSAEFNINTSTGVATFKSAPDYETKTSYSFTATATGVGGSATQSVTITITDIDETPPPTPAPVFSSSTATSVAENQTSAIALSASNTTSYAISGTDSALFNINTSSGVVTFKSAPDYEIPTDDGTNNTYIFTATASGAGGSVNQSVTVTVTDVNEVVSTTELYIKSAIYDNNRTTSTADDKLYLYYNKAIDENSIANVGSNYDIEGTGVLSTGTSDYNDTIFHRHTITLSSATELSTDDDNISLRANTITAENGDLPTDLNKTRVKKFNVFGRLKTGQTTSYAEFDDGNTTRGVARNYTDNTDGTVTDNATGLMWQQEDDNNTYTWANAISYCDNLTLATKSDWRLPTIEELVSIADKGEHDPAINPIFTNTNSSFYWSSTTDAGDATYAWSVYFGDGGDYIDDKTSTSFVRCVR